jgi:ankyrin repeat protein
MSITIEMEMSSTPPNILPPNRERMKLQVQEDLFKLIMKGDWEKVVEIYRHHPLAHKTKINDLGDTALHLAVSNGPESIVEDLVVQIISKEVKETLKIKNRQGNTPLHLAASMGSLRMCICIAEADPSLGTDRNNEGESPLFLAALHGKTDTFVCLHSICRSELEVDNSYYRKKGGETVLHCAVKREYLGEPIVKKNSLYLLN